MLVLLFAFVFVLILDDDMADFLASSNPLKAKPTFNTIVCTSQ